MENLVTELDFWQGKKVLVTGHTGFKGSWLTLWLLELKANVAGISLPPTKKSLFTVTSLEKDIKNIYCDIKDGSRFSDEINSFKPEIVFHLAAQSLVRESYRSPRLTFATNVMGTINLLDALRDCDSIRSVVIITSDKCYANSNWCWGYRESDSLGGKDPYSASKACAEMAVSSYRESFFSKKNVNIASARAGNVIGGGDWANDRLVPDLITSYINGKNPILRNPNAIRPWQHVCEPLWGYLLLAEKLCKPGQLYSESYNFGPLDASNKTVKWVAGYLQKKWIGSKPFIIAQNGNLPESSVLKLDSSKAREKLLWTPKLSIKQALDWTYEWYEAWTSNSQMKDITLGQIKRYSEIEPPSDN
jgi:CDP-glucose 4,6-dehydratase